MGQIPCRGMSMISRESIRKRNISRSICPANRSSQRKSGSTLINRKSNESSVAANRLGIIQRKTGNLGSSAIRSGLRLDNVITRHLNRYNDDIGIEDYNGQMVLLETLYNYVSLQQESIEKRAFINSILNEMESDLQQWNNYLLKQNYRRKMYQSDLILRNQNRNCKSSSVSILKKELRQTPYLREHHIYAVAQETMLTKWRLKINLIIDREKTLANLVERLIAGRSPQQAHMPASRAALAACVERPIAGRSPQQEPAKNDDSDNDQFAEEYCGNDSPSHKLLELSRLRHNARGGKLRQPCASAREPSRGSKFTLYSALRKPMPGREQSPLPYKQPSDEKLAKEDDSDNDQDIEEYCISGNDSPLDKMKSQRHQLPPHFLLDESSIAPSHALESLNLAQSPHGRGDTSSEHRRFSQLREEEKVLAHVPEAYDESPNHLTARFIDTLTETNKSRFARNHELLRKLNDFPSLSHLMKNYLSSCEKVQSFDTLLEMLLNIITFAHDNLRESEIKDEFDKICSSDLEFFTNAIRVSQPSLS